MTTHVEEIDKVESTPYAKVSTPDLERPEGCAEKTAEGTKKNTTSLQIETESTGKNEEAIFNEKEIPPEVFVVEGPENDTEAFSPMAKSSQHPEGEISANEATHVSLHDEKCDETLGKELLFVRDGNSNSSGWDNLRWMAYSGTKQIAHVGSVSRFFPGRRTFFWSGDEYLERVLVAFTEPQLILILRQPRDAKEVSEILDLPNGSSGNADDAGSYLVVESVIDPKTCKLKLSSLTTVTVVLPADVAVDDHRRRSCFELVTPIENIVLSAVRLRQGAERPLSSFHDAGAYLETTSTEHVLQKAICDAHRSEQGVLDLSWKHQVILGTLHSYAVLGNQGALHSAILCAKRSDAQSEFVDPRIIDAEDESGRTPLHYACASRLSSAVSALVKAGANVDLRVEPHKMSPCHLAALNLDSQSLEIILSVSRRPGVIDGFGRTPIYSAIMEGHSICSSKDPEALESCLFVLESHGAEIEPPMGFPHPVGALARSWSHEVLEVTLRHLTFTYPLVVPDLNDKRKVGISISAFFQYPVHSCLIALRSALTDNQGVALKGSTEKEICRTLEILFSCGFEPNERLEGLVAVFDGMDDLLAHVGFAPTQILGSAALDVMQQRDKLGDAIYLTAMKIISSVMYTLVSHGGRLCLDPPPSSRSKESDSSSISDASLKKNFTWHDPSFLKLQDNKRLIDLLGAARLKSAEKSWNEVASVPMTSGSFSFHTDKFPIENSEAPGGSDVKSCSICWATFGTITNRKHRCRISRRHVCNECSSKCISDGKEEHRVSDGQFLLGRHNLRASNTCKKLMDRKPPSATSMHAGLAKLEAQELGNRESLFGNVMGNMAKAVFGEEDRTEANSLEGLSHSLNHTRNLLHERGDKLNTLADKSDRLVTASKDFATMAKELNRQTQGGFFW